MNNKADTTLPADFDGVFRFTNWTQEEFKGKWGGVEYIFEPESTSPMIIPGASPEEVQSIRKKFARQLATEYFYKSDKFKNMEDVPPGGTPALYTDADLAPFVQRCLEPLKASTVKKEVLPKASEANLRKDNKGKNVTKVIEEGDSLLDNGSAVVA